MVAFYIQKVYFYVLKAFSLYVLPYKNSYKVDIIDKHSLMCSSDIFMDSVILYFVI